MQAEGLHICDFSPNLVLHILWKFGVVWGSRSKVMGVLWKVGVVFPILSYKLKIQTNAHNFSFCKANKFIFGHKLDIITRNFFGEFQKNRTPWHYLTSYDVISGFPPQKVPQKVLISARISITEFWGVFYLIIPWKWGVHHFFTVSGSQIMASWPEAIFLVKCDDVTHKKCWYQQNNDVIKKLIT